jgi:hypothetical protein
MAQKKIEHKAAKGQTLTLDELEAFIADARRSGAAGTELVSARVSFGGKIQQLSVDVPAATPSDAHHFDKP